LTRFGLFSNFRGKTCIDGGLSSPIPYKYEKSQKIFINVLPKFSCHWPFVRDDVKNCQILNITENYNVIFPIDYFLWSADWADDMYLKGYLAGIENKNKIQ
jgi:hypothetical protein